MQEVTVILSPISRETFLANITATKVFVQEYSVKSFFRYDLLSEDRSYFVVETDAFLVSEAKEVLEEDLLDTILCSGNIETEQGTVYFVHRQQSLSTGGVRNFVKIKSPNLAALMLAFNPEILR